MAKIISYDYSSVQSSKVEENDGDKFINTRIETRGHQVSHDFSLEKYNSKKEIANESMGLGNTLDLAFLII